MSGMKDASNSVYVVILNTYILIQLPEEASPGIFLLYVHGSIKSWSLLFVRITHLLLV
jgi:hypothetical protein